jgi:hypothetical protein
MYYILFGILFFSLIYIGNKILTFWNHIMKIIILWLYFYRFFAPLFCSA